MYADSVAPRSCYTFFIDAEQRAEFAAIQERDGISESEQIRRAIKAWIAEKGVKQEQAAPRRAGTRRKA